MALFTSSSTLLADGEVPGGPAVNRPIPGSGLRPRACLWGRSYTLRYIS
jgi:hypothetical protein